MREDIERIKEMEAAFDKVASAIAQLKAAAEVFRQVQTDADKLKRYYETQWMTDFQADEAGKLPPSLKRGVLSEDGLWDLLEENDELKATIK